MLCPPCYPTNYQHNQTLEMPVVRNGETGLELLANNAEHFIRRAVAEEDFAGGAHAEVSTVRLVLVFIAVCAVPSLTWLFGVAVVVFFWYVFYDGEQRTGESIVLWYLRVLWDDIP